GLALLLGGGQPADHLAGRGRAGLRLARDVGRRAVADPAPAGAPAARRDRVRLPRGPAPAARDQAALGPGAAGLGGVQGGLRRRHRRQVPADAELAPADPAGRRDLPRRLCHRVRAAADPEQLHPPAGAERGRRTRPRLLDPDRPALGPALRPAVRAAAAVPAGGRVPPLPGAVPGPRAPVRPGPRTGPGEGGRMSTPNPTGPNPTGPNPTGPDPTRADPAPGPETMTGPATMTSAERARLR